MTVHDDLATLRRHIGREWFASPRDTYPVDMSANRAALSRVADEIARLEQERDEAIRLRGIATEWAAELAGKKQAAEDEVARLRDGLREMLKLADGHPARLATVHGWKDHARALLADQDGAA